MLYLTGALLPNFGLHNRAVCINSLKVTYLHYSTKPEMVMLLRILQDFS